MDQAKAGVTPGSKEASPAATTCGERQWDTYSHRDCRSLSGMCQFTSEMRYDATLAKNSGARRFEPNGGESARSQEN